MRVRAAYADPPYLGCSVKHYGAMHEHASEFDTPKAHKDLVERLCDEYDCWALSLHAPSLPIIAQFIPKDARIAAWVKPFAAFKKGVTRAYTWEPVVFRFSDKRPIAITDLTWRDHLSEPITMRRGFPGAKPDRFAFWVFQGLALRPDDDFTDLFPGSGCVGTAWDRWKNRDTAIQTGIFKEARP